MAKMTISGLQTFVATYVAAAKQAGTWTGSTDNLFGLQDKIGKQITIDGSFEDKLPELDGEDLPYGKTIEEWFVDLILPTDYTAPVDGNTYGAVYHKPTVESAAYSYTLGRKKISQSKPYDDFERAALDATEAGNLTAKIFERLYQSESLYRFAQKKQLIANLVAKAKVATNAAQLVDSTTAIPTDTTTAEAFIKDVKKQVENASFANEGNNLGNCLIGASPELTLYIKKGVMPTVEVDALAGAFNKADLALPAKIKVVDDFGNDTKAWAVLVDTRGIKLHNGYRAVRTDVNGEEDFVTETLHSENTGFISKYTFVHVYTEA